MMGPVNSLVARELTADRIRDARRHTEGPAVLARTAHERERDRVLLSLLLPRR
jgi:hypothetical protein